MRNSFFFRSILSLLFFLIIPIQMTGTGKTVLEGYVYDTSLKYIPYSRVEIKNISDKSASGTGSFHVTYTDEKGKWKISIPSYGKIMVKVTSNGFKPDRSLIDMKVEKSLNNARTIVRSRMLSGIKHILWGSFDHSRLYVRSEYQKMIEEWIMAGLHVRIKDFVENKIMDKSRKNAYIFAGHASFLHGAEKESSEYFKLAGSPLWDNLKGKQKLKESKFEEAVSFYTRGATTRQRAYDLMKLGSEMEKMKKYPLMKKCFSQAMDDFSQIIVDYRFKWSDDLLNKRVECSRKAGKGESGGYGGELQNLLEKAADYCKKLKQAEIYYYCNEEKIDKVVLVEALHHALESPRKYFTKYKPPKLRGTKIRDKYIYDLQFVLDENGVVEEARKLVNQYPDMIRNTVPVLSYKVIRPLYGPNTLIGSGWQDFFRYSIAGRERLLDTDTVIVSAFPKWTSFMNQMYGKLWVSEKDGAILKIQWKHQNLNRKDLRTRGLIINRVPQMHFISTYGKVKGSLRFPSEYRIMENYAAGEDVFTRLDIRGVYRNYTFFGVDIDDVKINE